MRRLPGWVIQANGMCSALGQHWGHVCSLVSDATRLLTLSVTVSPQCSPCKCCLEPNVLGIKYIRKG